MSGKTKCDRILHLLYIFEGDVNYGVKFVKHRALAEAVYGFLGALFCVSGRSRAVLSSA